MDEQENNVFESYINRDMNVYEELKAGQLQAAKREAALVVVALGLRVAIGVAIFAGVNLLERKFK